MSKYIRRYQNIIVVLVMIVQMVVFVGWIFYYLSQYGYFGLRTKFDKSLRVDGDGNKTYTLRTYHWYKGDIISSSYHYRLSKWQVDSVKSVEKEKAKIIRKGLKTSP